MKLIKITLALVLIVLSGTIAQGQEKTTAQGLKYTIFTANQGEKIKVNDVVTFNFIQKTDKDSVLVSSYQNGTPARIQIYPSKNISDLMDFFTLLTVKDSAMAKFSSDSLFKGTEDQRPAFLPKGSSVIFLVKIEKIQTLDEAIAEEKQQAVQLQAAEKAAIEKYITDKQLSNVKSTASGLRYMITKPSAKPKPLSGDSVSVNYTGYTLDGKVFDSSSEAEAKKAGLDQPGRTYEPISLVVGQGQVIRGWDEGLLLLNEGSRAKFIIPSELGYGSRGAGQDIRPYSTLIFDVELVKVKPVKKPAGKIIKSGKPAPNKKTKAPAKKK